MSAPAPAACGVCEVHAESVFKIDGMDCHEEVAILERRLKHLTGLEAMSADVLGGRLLVTYDAARLSTATITDAVADTGMRAWLEHEQPHIVGTSFARQRLLVASGASLAAGLTLHWLQLAPPAVSVAACVASGTDGWRVSGTARDCVGSRADARHSRADDDSGRRRGRHRRVVRGGNGHLPFCRRPVPRIAQHGPRTSRCPCPHGPHPARRAGRTRGRRAPPTGGQRHDRRRAANPARCKGAARWHGHIRQQRREPGADHGGVAAGRQARWDRAVCRHDQRPRGARDARHAAAARHDARAHHSPRRSCASAARAVPGVCRAICRLLHPGGDRDCRRRRRDTTAGLPRARGRMAVSRPRAAGHLLPVCAGDLDAGLDRLGPGGRGQAGGARQGRHSPRAPRHDPRHRVRQDGHPDPRRARRRGRYAIRRHARVAAPGPRGGARIAIGAPDCRRDRAAREGPRRSHGLGRAVPCAAGARGRGAAAMVDRP